MIPHSVSPKWTSLTVANVDRCSPGGRGSVRKAKPVVLVEVVGLETVVHPDVEIVVHHGEVVGDRGQLHQGPSVQGRPRRSGSGFVHQRPENRQRAGSASIAVVRIRRGHDSSSADTIAATSSSLASGVMAAISMGGVMATTYSGMLPCLRAGSSSRFVRSSSSPAISLTRVSAGSITSSTKPRSAATYGLAKRSVYSSTSSAAPGDRVGGGLQLAPVEDLDRALRAHHRQLGRRPRERQVGADRLGVHHDVGAAVGLARDDLDARARWTRSTRRAAWRRGG